MWPCSSSGSPWMKRSGRHSQTFRQHHHAEMLVLMMLPRASCSRCGRRASPRSRFARRTLPVSRSVISSSKSMSSSMSSTLKMRLASPAIPTPCEPYAAPCAHRFDDEVGRGGGGIGAQVLELLRHDVDRGEVAEREVDALVVVVDGFRQMDDPDRLAPAGSRRWNSCRKLAVFSVSSPPIEISPSIFKSTRAL